VPDARWKCETRVLVPALDPGRWTGTGRPSWMALIAALACDDLTIALGLLCSRLASVKP
jgi:hypothetical protein